MAQRITYCKPGKAKQYGPNANKHLRFVYKGMNATTNANVQRIAASAMQTAQDVFEKNYDALQKIKLVFSRS